MSTEGLTSTQSPLQRLTPNLRTKEAIAGYLFLMPWLLGLALFIVGPMMTSGFLSFTRYDVVNPPKLVGLKNFIEIFTKDRLFWPSMMLTFRYALIVVPLSLVGALSAAMLLNQALRGTTLFRTFFFLPHLTPIVAAAVLWGWIFNADVGPINHWIRTITGSDNAPGWFRDPDWAMTGLRGSQVSAAAFGITGNSQHPSEAFQILDFYSTKEDGIEHVLFGAGSPGGRADVWDSEELFSVHPIFRQHIAYYPDGPRKWHRPANARTLEFVDTLNNNLQAVWTELTTFDEGVEQTHLLVQEILDKEALA